MRRQRMLLWWPWRWWRRLLDIVVSCQTIVSKLIWQIGVIISNNCFRSELFFPTRQVKSIQIIGIHQSPWNIIHRFGRNAKCSVQFVCISVLEIINLIDTFSQNGFYRLIIKLLRQLAQKEPVKYISRRQNN